MDKIENENNVINKKPIKMQRLTPEILGISSALSVEEIKERVAYDQRLKSDGHKIQRSGRQPKCRCPFHDDSTPSFVISKKNDYGYCFGCDWHGDIIQYEQDYHDVDLGSALEKLTEWLETGKCGERKVFDVVEEEIPIQILEHQRQSMGEASAALFADEVAILKIAADRNWLPGTIAKLAKDGDLGWSDGRLTFNYSTGLKLREWPAKEFRWSFGKNGLWRDHVLGTSDCVFLTEGETDAISLLDCGLEKEPGIGVIAVPGSKAFKQQWAEYFTGKHVVICFDDDAAGVQGARRILQMLTPVVATVRTWFAEEVK
jgi:CHC2 zinc finger/Toprim-like